MLTLSTYPKNQNLLNLYKRKVKKYMVSLSEKIEAEKENVERTLKDLEMAMKKKEKSVIELSAIATFLHNIYNGIENILKQILKEENIKLSKSDTWHKDLLELSAENEIISEKLVDKLREYLTFRHFFYSRIWIYD